MRVAIQRYGRFVTLFPTSYFRILSARERTLGAPFAKLRSELVIKCNPASHRGVFGQIVLFPGHKAPKTHTGGGDKVKFIGRFGNRLYKNSNQCLIRPL